MAFIAAGCAGGNPYAEFYRGKPDGKAVENYIPPAGPLEIYSTNNVERDREALEAQGYVPFGYSSFNADANRVSERQLREQAAKVGASVVLVSSRYTHTRSGAMPMEMPNSSTSYTTGDYGTAITTTYGSQTVMVPYNIQRNEFTAIFFVKRKLGFGAFYGAIDAATRIRLQTNAGVLVKVVVDGTPAFHADILPGDTLLSDTFYSKFNCLGSGVILGSSTTSENS